jgi:hypothetical protein
MDGSVMKLDLEIAGAVRDLAPHEEADRRVITPARLRDSHHAVAKLLAKGLRPLEVAMQTGYALSRISVLQMDPAFKELIEFYRRDEDAVSAELEAQFELVARDVKAVIHDRVLDEPDNIPTSQLMELFKTFADRAGYAPISRSINKNVNLNYGERLDAARKRKDAA